MNRKAELESQQITYLELIPSTVTSSRRTIFCHRSKRFSTTYSCRCSRPQTIQNNILNSIVSCNTSSDSIQSTTNPKPSIHYSNVMWVHLNNGPTRIIRRTRTTSTTCTLTWRFWITSARSVAWIRLYCVPIAVRPDPFSIWCAVSWCRRIFRMDCCCAKCQYFSICTIWRKLASQCRHYRTIHCFWIITETRCPSIWHVDFAFHSVQTIRCNSISQKWVKSNAVNDGDD